MHKYTATLMFAGSLMGALFGSGIWSGVSGSLGFVVGGAIGFFIDSREYSKATAILNNKENLVSSTKRTTWPDGQGMFMTPHCKDLFVFIILFTVYFVVLHHLYNSDEKIATEWMEATKNSYLLLSYTVPAIDYKFNELTDAGLDKMAYFVRHILSIGWIFGIITFVWTASKYKEAILYYKEKDKTYSHVKKIISFTGTFIALLLILVVGALISYFGIDSDLYIKRPYDYGRYVYGSGVCAVIASYSIPSILFLIISDKESE